MNLPNNWEKILTTVNAEVNVLPYKSDANRYGEPEFWERIDARGGDCEDYALEKLHRLHDAGYPIASLRLATCNVPYDVNLNSPRGGHAVLVVATPSGTRVLSNGLDVVSLSWFLARGFQPLQIQKFGGSPEMISWMV